MTKVELLNKLERDGVLDLLVKSGLVSTTFIFYREIYLQVDYRIRLGLKKMDAYQDFAEQYNVHENTIMNACKAMNESFTIESVNVE